MVDGTIRHNTELTEKGRGDIEKCKCKMIVPRRFANKDLIVIKLNFYYPSFSLLFVFV